MGAGHVAKRESRLGRWVPFLFYSLNVILWLITGMIAKAYVLLWLALLALPAPVLYLLRTRRSSS